MDSIAVKSVEGRGREGCPLRPLAPSCCLYWPDDVLAGAVPGQAVPGVLQGVGDLREDLLYGLPHPGDHDPLTHLGGDVQGDHLPVVARADVGGPGSVSIVEGASFVL